MQSGRSGLEAFLLENVGRIILRCELSQFCSDKSIPVLLSHTRKKLKGKFEIDPIYGKGWFVRSVPEAVKNV